jgi:ceramide glucosyltransferase
MGVSILKPLCGLDDGLRENLLAFTALSYPEYELLLGVASSADSAFAVAAELAALHPGQVRVVLQRGARGLNPKVNQLISLAAAARYDVLVISDSNVRVDADYLQEIADQLADPRVGLVTHATAATGEQSLGALFDNLELCAATAPSTIAASQLLGRPMVVGKSMALRRADLVRLGGFERVKDLLAEDYVLGRLVADELGLRVVIARQPILCVAQRRSIADFMRRYLRWGVIQRRAAGTPIYLSLAVRHPVPFAALLFLAEPGLAAGLLLLGVCAVKSALDAASMLAIHRESWTWKRVAAVPVKDILSWLAWLGALFTSEINWRGHRLRVLPGTRLVPAGRDSALPPAVALHEGSQ